MSTFLNTFNRLVAALLCTAVSGCAEMNHAQTNAAGGAVIGGLVAFTASKVVCNDKDVACRNRLIAAGMAGGAVAGYITGQEMDLQIAQKAAEELRLKGYQPQIVSKTVETDVPYDAEKNIEIPNAQLSTYPKEKVVMRKKHVQSLSSMTVPLKNRNDAAERTYVSSYLLEKANQMNGRQELVIPSGSSARDRIAINNVAKQKNILVRESKGASVISLASL